MARSRQKSRRKSRSPKLLRPRPKTNRRELQLLPARSLARPMWSPLRELAYLRGPMSLRRGHLPAALPTLRVELPGAAAIARAAPAAARARPWARLTLPLLQVLQVVIPRVDITK